MLKDLSFYEVVCAENAKARQDRLVQREKKNQEGTLRQASGGNHPTTSFTIRLSAKKKKSFSQPTKKAPAPNPASPYASTSASSFVIDTEQDSTADSPSAGIEPETEVEPMVPCIICEAKKEEDMAANLRVDFKERQHKCLSESILVAPLTANKSYVEVPRTTPISDIPPTPKPSFDAIRPNRVPTARPPIGKDARPELNRASTGPAPPNSDFVELTTLVLLHLQAPRAPSIKEMVELLKQVPYFTRSSLL